MAKDPAALLYIDTWLSSTAEMDADCRGWYLNLILHQYDKGSLPNDLEKLAQLAVVRFSEFERFKQVFEQVLKQKFKLCDDNRLRNDKADEVIRKRQKFTDKRSKSGSVGVVVKLAKSIGFNTLQIERLKTELYSSKVDIEKAKDKQVLKQLLKLYINEDGNGDVNKDYSSVNQKKSVIPSVEEFVAYGLEQASKHRLNVSKTSLTMKYEAWKLNDWKNGNDQPVKNWKASLINTLKYIQDEQKKDDTPRTIDDLGLNLINR